MTERTVAWGIIGPGSIAKRFAAACGWAGSNTMVTVIIGDIFGTRNLGVIMGVLSGGWAIGAALGPAIAGFLFDLSGHYFAAFGAGAAASLLGALSIVLIKRAPGRTSL